MGLAIAVTVVILSSMVVVGVFFLIYSFPKYPAENIARTALSLLIGLCAMLGAPSFSGKVDLNADWGPKFVLKSKDVNFDVGGMKEDWRVAMGIVTITILGAMVVIPLPSYQARRL